MDNEELIAGISLDQDNDGIPDNQPIPAEETPVIQPEVITPQTPKGFPAPFRSRIGRSSVDLSIPENEELMKQEYDEYWNYGKKRGFLGVPYVSDEFKGERDKLKAKFIAKYHGMSLEEYEAARQEDNRKNGGFYPGANNPAETMNTSTRYG